MPGVPFKPGQSGNPGGRPAALKAIRERIRERGEELIEGLLNIAADEDVAPKDRILATRELLDRAYGKAVQPVDGDGEGGAIAHSIAVRFVAAKGLPDE